MELRADLFKIKQEFTNSCSDRVSAIIAATVYFELLNVVHVNNLTYQFNHELSTFYFRGNKNLNDATTNLYIPHPTTKPINLRKIEAIQSKLSNGNENLILCLCDTSSTIVYYRVTKGLKRPSQQLSIQQENTSTQTE